MEQAPVLSRPSSAGSAIVPANGQVDAQSQELALREKKATSRCMILFKMGDAPEAEAFFRNAQVSKVAQFVVGTQDFMGQYVNGKEKIPRKMVQVPLEIPPAVVEKVTPEQKPKLDKVVNFTCEQLGETLFSDNTTNATSFCKSIMHFQMVANGEYFSKLDTLFQIEKDLQSTSPIPKEELEAVLPLKELTMHVVEMTKAMANSGWMSALFLENLLNKLNAGTQAQDLANQVQKTLKTIDALNGKIREWEVEKVNHNAEKQQVLKDQADMEAILRDGQNMVDYYESLIQETKALLTAAEADEKRYTYNCYGPFSWVWQNDVNLAKEKVRRYNDKLQDLFAKKIDAGSQKNETQERQATKELAKKLALHEGNLTLIDKNLDQAEAQMKDLIKTRDGKYQRLVIMMKHQGCESVDQMLNAMDAMKSVGQSGATQSMTGQVVVEGWVKDLNFFAVALNRMARAKALTEQIVIIENLKKWTRDPENVFCEWLRCIVPLTSIPFISDPGNPYISVDLPVLDVEKIAENIDWSKHEEPPLPTGLVDLDWVERTVPPSEVDAIEERLTRDGHAPWQETVTPVQLPSTEPAAAQSDGVDLLDYDFD